MMLYDRIAVEKHIYTAARAERIQIANNRILTIKAEGGPQQPLNQRPDFAQAKRECNWQGPKKNTEPLLAVNK